MQPSAVNWRISRKRLQKLHVFFLNFPNANEDTKEISFQNIQKKTDDSNDFHNFCRAVYVSLQSLKVLAAVLQPLEGEITP